MTEIIPVEVIENKILFIRGKKVMIDRDLAMLYGIETKALNQAVKRNLARFPEDFMFQLSKSESNELVTNCDRFRTLKHSSANPYAFTEQDEKILSIFEAIRALMSPPEKKRGLIGFRREEE